jgi:hypothetical protein
MRFGRRCRSPRGTFHFLPTPMRRQSHGGMGPDQPDPGALCVGKGRRRWAGATTGRGQSSVGVTPLQSAKSKPQASQAVWWRRRTCTCVWKRELLAGAGACLLFKAEARVCGAARDKLQQRRDHSGIHSPPAAGEIPSEGTGARTPTPAPPCVA